MFFYEDDAGRHVPRALLLDLEPRSNLCMPKNLHTVWTIFVATLALWVYAGIWMSKLYPGEWANPSLLVALAKAALRDY